MDGGRSPPVTVDGLWRPEQTRRVRNKLQLYFQSKKRSGGGECRVEVQEEAARAEVHFREEDVRLRVLSRTDHLVSVDGESILLHLSSAPSSTRSDAHPDSKTQKAEGEDDHPAPAAMTTDSEAGRTTAVLLEHVGATMSPDLLVALVESVSGAEEEHVLLEMMWAAGRAAATFSRAADAERFLAAGPTSTKLQKYGVTVRPLEAPTSVRVEDLPSTHVRDLLEVYFEKTPVDPGLITMIPEEEAAIVTFTDPEVVRTICLKRDHRIGSLTVKVYPYYESLGAALYGPDRPLWRMPEVLVEPVHPVVWRFLLMKQLPPSLDDRMRPHFCCVDMESAEAKLRPLPALFRQKDLTAERVASWAPSALAAFRRVMADFAAFEVSAPPAAWKKAEKEVLSLVKQDGVLVHDGARALLVVAGRLEDIQRVRACVEDAVQRAVKELQREGATISEAVDLSPAWFHILTQDGLHAAAGDLSPDLKLAYDDSAHKLTVTGLRAEVFQTKTWILERSLKMSKKEVRAPPGLLSFLRAAGPAHLSQDLFTSHGIRAIYSADRHGVWLQAASDQALADAEKKMLSLLTLQTLQVEDPQVLELPGWTELVRQLLDAYNSAKKKTVSVQAEPLAVAGFVSPVQEVSRSLTEFISNYSRVQESLRLQSCALVHFIHRRRPEDWARISQDQQVSLEFEVERRRVVLGGARLHVRRARAELQRLAGGLLTDTLTVDKPGAKKYFQAQGSVYLSTLMLELGCVVLLSPEGQDQDLQDLPDLPDDEGSSCYCSVRTAGGVLVSVTRANICRFAADAVVNAANEELQHVGGVALALLRAAGAPLQSACDQLVATKGTLRPGDAVVTAAFNLPCRHVVHAVGPRYSAREQERSASLLRRAVKESLRQAEAAGCSTVALPAISSGVFGFPVDLCARNIAAAVREFCDQPPGPRTLTHVHLVDNKERTVGVLASAVSREFSDLRPTMTVPKRPAGTGPADPGYQSGSSRDRSPSRASRGRQVSEQGGGGGAAGGATGGGAGPGRSHSAGGGGSPGPGGDEGTLRLQQTTAEGLKIVLLKENIEDQRTDVIVNTVSEDLNLSQGAVSRALLGAAGPGLQREVQVQARGSMLRPGAVVTTGGGRLACRKVFHAVCPYWSNGGGQEEEDLVSIIRHCLEEAEKLRMASLSFPALGTGNLRFPRELVARLLLAEVRSFSDRRRPRHLKEVLLVVHPGDRHMVECFIAEFTGHAAPSHHQQEAPVRQPQPASASFSQVSSPSLGVYRMQLGQVTLQVSSGDITKDTSEVIVNSSNHDFTLKTGVSKAILDGAGLTVEMEISLIVKSPGYQPRSMILTSAGKLPSRNILHMVGQNHPARIQEVVCGVLRFCEENRFASVCFPALGTGQGGVDPAAVADAMVGGVVEFVRKKQPQQVHSVKILIFQTAMTAPFHRSMRRRVGEEVVEKGVISKIKDSFTSFFLGEERRASSGRLLLQTEEFQPTEFQLCADDVEVIRQAKKKIEKIIVEEQAKRTVVDPILSQFSQDQVDQLKTLQRNLMVSIRLEQDQEAQEVRLHLEGLTRDVLAAEADISKLIREAERAKNLRERAELLSELVQWHHQEPGGAPLPFDVLTNLSLEEALEKNQTVKIQIHNQNFTARPLLRKAEATRGRQQVELLRAELKDSLPPHWDDMQDHLVKLFAVAAGSAEFSEVEQEVTRTGLTPNIVRVERVQNRTLWQSYQLKKKEMEVKNKQTNNERRLFHGTKDTSVDLINGRGFNRSYAGIHGTMFGNGSYFAVDPVYSAKSFATPDSSGLCRMYLARVLVGDYTQGKAGLITPPAKPGNAADLHDSVVDNAARPTMFVVFSDTQAYPEYLITFT